MFRIILSFYGEEFLETFPTLKMDDHPLAAVVTACFDVLAATPNIRNLRTLHDVVTEKHKSLLALQKYFSVFSLCVCKGKAKVVTVHAMKAYGGRTCITPPILDTR